MVILKKAEDSGTGGRFPLKRIARRYTHPTPP